jgi:hypothetical protein
VLVGGFSFLQQRLHDLEQLVRAAVRLCLGRADHDVLHLVRQRIHELRARLLRADDDDLGGLQPPDHAVELHGDALQVLGDELLDVPRVTRLRPAALVVPARLVLGTVDDLLEPPCAEAKDLPALAADERDDRAVVAAHELCERREVEAAADVYVVRDRPRDRKRPENVSGHEHAQPASTFTAELVVEELPDPGEVPLQPLAVGVRELVVTGLDPLLGP